MNQLPFSQAAENNREPILHELKRLLDGCSSVLEIGAGTGQHATEFAAALPHVRWQPTEHPSAMEALTPRCEHSAAPNLLPPLSLDMAARPWAVEWPDAVYTANTLHIVSETLVEGFFGACGDQSTAGSLLLVYGPFNYGGHYTSPSNERFDAWLKGRDPSSGIRDFEWLDELAAKGEYQLREDIAMPANNRLLCWART